MTISAFKSPTISGTIGDQHTEILDHHEFLLAFERFVVGLLQRAMMRGLKWDRVSREEYDHRRIQEVGVWTGASTDAERGHVFQVLQPIWDGEVDWDEIDRVLASDDLATHRHEVTKPYLLTSAAYEAKQMFGESASVAKSEVSS